MKNFLRQCASGILFGAVLVSAQAQADEFRVGFVNTDRIFRESAAAKTAQAKLEQEFAKREKELTDAGFVISKTDKTSLDYQYVVLAVKQ